MHFPIEVALFGLLWAAASGVDTKCTEECCTSSLGITRVSIESVEFPGYYWRACKDNQFYVDDNNNGRLTNCVADNTQFRRDITFQMHEPGLTGVKGTVSFESIVKPGAFLRAAGANVILQANYQENAIIKQQCTFKKLPSQSNGSGYGNFRFESSVQAYANYRICRCDSTSNWQLELSNGAAGCPATTHDAFLRETAFRITLGQA